MLVVSDTSPVLNLAAIGRLDFLERLYGKIIIPEAVFTELAATGAEAPQCAAATTSSWLERRPVTYETLVHLLLMELDQGEAEAIALAVETNADLLLIDERRGRTVASRLGRRCLGLLGVLIEAKRKGLTPSIKPLIEDLMVKAGFWMSDRLIDRVLREAGE